MIPVTVLLLAGSRPGGDPLAAHFGIADKPLVRIAGRPMLDHVARTLLDHAAVRSIVVLAQEPERLLADGDIAWMRHDPRIRFQIAPGSVSAAVVEGVAHHNDGWPFLVTTADHPLLDHAILDAFLIRARDADADLAVGLVERRVLNAAYPDNRRTWLRFRKGAYSGANLFFLNRPPALAALELWRLIEQQRKKGRAIVGAFGPVILAGVVLRLLTLPAALRMAGRRLGLTAAAIEIPIAEACIDVDKPADHVLATAILERRARDIATIRP